MKECPEIISTFLLTDVHGYSATRFLACETNFWSVSVGQTKAARGQALEATWPPLKMPKLLFLIWNGRFLVSTTLRRWEIMEIPLSVLGTGAVDDGISTDSFVVSNMKISYPSPRCGLVFLSDADFDLTLKCRLGMFNWRQMPTCWMMAISGLLLHLSGWVEFFASSYASDCYCLSQLFLVLNSVGFFINSAPRNFREGIWLGCGPSYCAPSGTDGVDAYY